MTSPRRRSTRYAKRHLANRLLVPVELVLRYFHQRFVADDVFQSPSVTNSRTSTRRRAPTLSHGEHRGRSRHETASAGLSFQVEGVDRNTHDRQLYTQAERVEALTFTARCPSAGHCDPRLPGSDARLLRDAGGRVQEIATNPSTAITAKDLADFDDYVSQWRAGATSRTSWSLRSRSLRSVVRLQARRRRPSTSNCSDWPSTSSSSTGLSGTG